jgi:hypothetical protein
MPGLEIFYMRRPFPLNKEVRDEGKMNDRMLRIIKLLWLPILLLLLIVVEPYLGISKTPYRWAYLGLQVLLFIAYTYILFKDRPKYVPADRKFKGKHKQRPK